MDRTFLEVFDRRGGDVLATAGALADVAERSGGPLVVRLGPGEYGWTHSPRRRDACLAPCLATLTQTPVHEVPAPPIGRWLADGMSDEQMAARAWQRVSSWLKDAKGFDLMVHDVRAHGAPALDRWVAVCESRDPRKAVLGTDQTRLFTSHCVIFCRDKALLNPAVAVRPCTTSD